MLRFWVWDGGGALARVMQGSPLEFVEERMDCKSRLGALVLATLLGGAAGCNDGTGYVRDNVIYVTADAGPPKGTACTLDSECAPLRCQGGVCTDLECTTEADCREDELCLFNECTPDTSFECTADIHPIIDVNPTTLVDFGAVAMGSTETRTVTITNLGSCLLTLQGIGLSTTSSRDFACANGMCDTENFPRRVAPGRRLEVDVTLTPTVPGAQAGELQIRSDDENFPTLKLALVGRYEGTPRFLVEPEVLDFGYVNFSAPPPGNTVTRTVRLSNVGEGNASLTIKDASLRSAGLPGFAFTPEISTPLHQVVLRPVQTGADCLTTQSCLDVQVTFTPPNAANFANDLIFTYDPAPDGVQPYVKVQLKGFSTTPPVLQLSEATVGFGDQTIGSTVEERVITVTNAGQTDLTLQISLDPLSSTDFSIVQPSASTVPVPPGDYANFRIKYDPAVLGQVAGKVLVASNDPVIYNAAYEPGTQLITVRGTGTPATFNDLLKVEMTWENGDNGWFGNDFRYATLHLESPVGEDCTEPIYQLGQNGQILGILTDPCSQWMMGGSPRWMAIGAAKEPQRIILVNAGETEGDYKVQVSYEQDCASIPTGLVADLLGIAVDALVGYASGGTIDLGAGDIAGFISNNCWDHASSATQVTVFINGVAAQQCTKTLGARGDVCDVVKINRHNGVFTAQCQ